MSAEHPLANISFNDEEIENVSTCTVPGADPDYSNCGKCYSQIFQQKYF
jgi:hypothetical protein